MSDTYIAGSAQIELRAPLDKLSADFEKAKKIATGKSREMADAVDRGLSRIGKSGTGIGKAAAELDAVKRKAKNASEAMAGSVERTGRRISVVTRKAAVDWGDAADKSAKAQSRGSKQIEAASDRARARIMDNAASATRSHEKAADAAARAWERSSRRIVDAQGRTRDEKGRYIGGGGKKGGSSSSSNDEEDMPGIVALGTKFAGPLISVYAAKKVMDYANAWQEARNKLLGAGIAQDQVNDKLQQVYNIAQAAHAPLEGAVTLYARMTRSAGMLGATQDEVATATSNVLKAMAVGGATTSEMSSAVTQLTQALQSGVLRGEEFNAIMENAPLIAQAIAKEFGVTVQSLRAMAMDGQLSADRVLKAIIGMGEGTNNVNDQFKNMDTTIGQSFNNLWNSATKLAGAFGEQTGAAWLLTTAVDGLAGAMDILGTTYPVDEVDLFSDGMADLIQKQKEAEAAAGKMRVGMRDGKVVIEENAQKVEMLNGFLARTVKYLDDLANKRIDITINAKFNVDSIELDKPFSALPTRPEEKNGPKIFSEPYGQREDGTYGPIRQRDLISDAPLPDISDDPYLGRPRAEIEMPDKKAGSAAAKAEKDAARAVEALNRLSQKVDEAMAERQAILADLAVSDFQDARPFTDVDLTGALISAQALRFEFDEIKKTVAEGGGGQEMIDKATSDLAVEYADRLGSISLAIRGLREAAQGDPANAASFETAARALESFDQHAAIAASVVEEYGSKVEEARARLRKLSDEMARASSDEEQAAFFEARIDELHSLAYESGLASEALRELYSLTPPPGMEAEAWARRREDEARSIREEALGSDKQPSTSRGIEERDQLETRENARQAFKSGFIDAFNSLREGDFEGMLSAFGDALSDTIWEAFVAQPLDRLADKLFDGLWESGLGGIIGGVEKGAGSEAAGQIAGQVGTDVLTGAASAITTLGESATSTGGTMAGQLTTSIIGSATQMGVATTQQAITNASLLALSNAATMAATALMQVAASGGVGGGLLGGLLGGLGGGGFPAIMPWAEGGYTGPGPKHKEAGRVHKGEVIFNQRDVSRHGGPKVLEDFRKGRRKDTKVSEREERRKAERNLRKLTVIEAIERAALNGPRQIDGASVIGRNGSPEVVKLNHPGRVVTAPEYRRMRTKLQSERTRAKQASPFIRIDGRKAVGGRGQRGATLVGGERGQELFVPDAMADSVARPYSNMLGETSKESSAASGSGSIRQSTTNHISIYAPGADAAQLRRVERKLDAVNSSIEPRATSAAVKANDRGYMDR